MGIWLLIAAGIGFALLFALNNLLKTIFRRATIGFLDILLAFMTTLILLAGLVAAQLGETPDPIIRRAALLAAVGLEIVSLLVLLLEIFRPQRWKGSRGVLGMYSGLLVIAAAFTVPLTATYFAATPTAVAQSVASAPTARPSVTALRRAIAPTASPTDLPSRTPTSSRTPRPTRTEFHFSTRTPTLTPTPVTPCVATVQNNLRLRASPNRDAETLATIPFNTNVELYGQGEISEGDSRWWYTVYEGQEGWLDGQYLLVGSACESLPERGTP